MSMIEILVEERNDWLVRAEAAIAAEDLTKAEYYLNQHQITRDHISALLDAQEERDSSDNFYGALWVAFMVFIGIVVLAGMANA